MTPDQFRALCLSFPHALERPHFERASFRVDVPKGKIFVTLLTEDGSANLSLTPDEQSLLMESAPEIFSKVPNKWGDQGWTTLQIRPCDAVTAKSALTMAWRHAAPGKWHGALQPDA